MCKNKFLRRFTVWLQPASAHHVLGIQTFPPFLKHPLLLHPWHCLCLKWAPLSCSSLFWPIPTHLLRLNLNVITSVECSPTASSWVRLSSFLCCWTSLSTLFSPLWMELMVDRSHVSVSLSGGQSISRWLLGTCYVTGTTGMPMKKTDGITLL